MAESVTTRAALLPAVGTRLRVVELDLAPPGPGEVRVRLHASGVCSDDLNAFDGSIEVPCPAVLGHEGAGVVEEVGEGVSALAVGDHVALSWAPYCGHCEQCLRDLPHLCGTAWPKMLAGGLLDGTTRLRFGGAVVHHYCFLSSFAERAVVPERSCVRIPADVPFDVAALVGCAVASGVCAVWRTAGVRPGERVAVFGLGGTGLAAVIGSVAAGASQIVAVDAREARLERARELGATSTVVWQGGAPEVAAAVRDASGGGVDYAFEAAGRPAAAEAAFLSTRARGRGGAVRDPPRRCHDHAAGAVDPAHGAAGAGLDLRLCAARPRLPADPRPAPARPPADRPAHLAPAVAGRGGRGDGPGPLGRRDPRHPRAGVTTDPTGRKRVVFGYFLAFAAAAALGWWR